jgi:hypothetical protein
VPSVAELRGMRLRVATKYEKGDGRRRRRGAGK